MSEAIGSAEESLEQAAQLAVYAQVCESYRAIDDSRMRLLALLPLATGTGILVLLGRTGDPSPVVVLPAAIFGIIATLGLFTYELHGIEKCHHYIVRGQELEKSLQVSGQFTGRPKRVLKVISELLAAALIYPASLAGWTFVLLYPLNRTMFGLPASQVLTAVVLVFAFAFVALVLWAMEHNRSARQPAAAIER